jgi:protein SCO1/2
LGSGVKSNGKALERELRLMQVKASASGASHLLSMKCTLFIALIVTAFALVSCKRVESDGVAEPGPPPQTFVVQGILRSIDFAGRNVTVEHEDIAGLMPAMTMPFDVKTMAEVEPLKAGDAIEFRLIVNAKASWIEGVKKIDPREIQLPESKVAESDPTARVARLKEGDVLPEFQLVDSKGRQVTQATFAGKPLLITFIFTRCPIPNFCPLMMNNFREIQQALAETPDQAASVQLLSISFDSEFDTPEVLAHYAAQHTKDTDQWRFATGTAAETRRLTRAFSVALQPESGTISHGLATALVGANGVIRNIWRGNGWKPAEVVEALRGL